MEFVIIYEKFTERASSFTPQRVIKAFVDE